jgi:hypothetical protein
MSASWSSIDGDIRTRLSARVLATRLSAAGIEVRVKPWFYGDGDLYIQIMATDDFTLSRVALTGYRVDALSSSVRRMRSAVCRVSAVLSDLKIAHRFWLYSGQRQRVDYIHHLWPDQEASRLVESSSFRMTTPRFVEQRNAR